MAGSFEQLVFEIIARDRQASAAFDRFRRTVDQASGSVDRNTGALDRNSQILDKHAKSSRSALGAVVGLGAAFIPVTAGAAAAGVGFAAFAGLAVPSVVKVAKALTGPGGLEASWVTLDSRQRNAALGVQALGARYSALAHAMEPRTFQVFNTALGFANSLLGPTGKLAETAGQGVESFLVQFSAHAGLQQFVTFLSTIARPALESLGGDVTHIAHAVFQLIQSFAGTGLMELRLLSGVFTALDTSITFLAGHAPALTSVALGVGGLALALAKIGALGGVLRLTGLSSIAAQMTGFAAATRGASLAEKGLLASTTALEAITPFGWAVLGAAALGGLVYWASRFKTVTDSSIAVIEAQNKAVGFNTAGYFYAADAVAKANTEQQRYRVTLVNLHTGMAGNTVAIGSLTGATAAYTAEQKKLVAEGVAQNTFLEILEQKYHITREAAISLAQHSGVLAAEVNKGGAAMRDSVSRAEAYADANLKAQKPTTELAADISDFANKTLTATQRTTALTNALKLFFNPAVTADQDTITLRNDQVALAKALQDSGGKTGLLTQKQRDARSAFDTYISQVAQTAQSAFNATGKTSSYTGVINDSLPFLRKAAGHNKALREEIQKLIDTERGLRSRTIRIEVSGTGTWKLPGQPGSHPVFAKGGRVPGHPAWGDVFPALLKGGEAVVPTELVPPLAPYLRAHGVPGFASGGLAGMAPWVSREYAATVSSDENRVAKALTAFLSGLGVGGGGGGGGETANQALGRAMMLTVWNAGQWSALQALWQRESGWNQFAANPTSGAYGIPQSLPASKMAAAGADWLTNPATQIRWGLNYIAGRYGSPGAAWAHELAVGWYDQGGYLPPGASVAVNTTGRPEPVGTLRAEVNLNLKLNGQQLETIRLAWVRGGGTSEASRLEINRQVRPSARLNG